MHMNRSLSLLSMGLLIAVANGSANADGMRQSAKDVMMEPVSTWTGVYIAGSVGYGISTTEINHFASISGESTVITRQNDDVSGDGATGTIAIGYDRQLGGYLLGVFADYTFGELDGSGTLFADRPGGAAAYVEPYEITYDNTFAIGARFGVIREHNTLLYATAGYTQTELEFDGEINEDLSGYFVGLGVEQKVRDGLSLKLEYRYSAFEDADILNSTSTRCGSTCTQRIDSESEIHAIRVGVAYKFEREHEYAPLK